MPRGLAGRSGGPCGLTCRITRVHSTRQTSWSICDGGVPVIGVDHLPWTRTIWQYRPGDTCRCRAQRLRATALARQCDQEGTDAQASSGYPQHRAGVHAGTDERGAGRGMRGRCRGPDGVRRRRDRTAGRARRGLRTLHREAAARSGPVGRRRCPRAEPRGPRSRHEHPRGPGDRGLGDGGPSDRGLGDGGTGDGGPGDRGAHRGRDLGCRPGVDHRPVGTRAGRHRHRHR